MGQRGAFLKADNLISWELEQTPNGQHPTPNVQWQKSEIERRALNVNGFICWGLQGTSLKAESIRHSSAQALNNATTDASV